VERDGSAVGFGIRDAADVSRDGKESGFGGNFDALKWLVTAVDDSLAI
jgi:hypothetical protein